MRISTDTLYRSGVTAILDRQTLLVRLQQRLASGLNFSTAAEAPAAYAEVMRLDNRLVELERYSATVSMAQHRLQMEESTLADVTESLQRVRELTLQANNGLLSAADRQAIGAELQERLNELLALSNRDDGAGHFLFSGAGGTSPPFALSTSGAVYSGDQQVRQLTVSVGQQIAEGDSGAEVFLRPRNGTGIVRVAADTANTGSAVLDQIALDDPANWDGDSYTVDFSAGTYEVRNSANVVVTSGIYQPYMAIQAAGTTLTFSGIPSDGDRFELTPSEPQDVFQTVSNILDTVDNETRSAHRQNRLFNGLQDLDRAIDHILAIRARVGGRLQALDDVAAAQESLSVQLQSARSELRDVDYASVISDLQQQLVSLQAAQQAFMKVQGLSLFDYLR